MQTLTNWFKKPLVFSALLLLATSFTLNAEPDSKSLTRIECDIKPIQDSPGHFKGKPYPHLPTTNGTSTNWSGYVAVTSFTTPEVNSVSSVYGSWVVPTITPVSGPAYSSFWVGIDGFSDGTVEQIGTEHDWTEHGQHNYAWFEMFPRGSYEIVGFPVNIGDQIGGKVTYKGKKVFVLQLFNYTQLVSTTVPLQFTKSAKAQRSSANWIVEAPSLNGVLPLADFGVAAFTDCSATINGVTGPINDSHWVEQPITMEANGVVKAEPSVLNVDGNAFNVVWTHQ